MAQHMLLIIGDGYYDKIVLKKYVEKHKFEKVEYHLKEHKRLVHRKLFGKVYLWLFNRGNSEPIGIQDIADKQDYKKVTPATLKVIVNQNITRDYLKSLKVVKAFGGIGRRKMLILGILIFVAVMVLKATGRI